MTIAQIRGHNVKVAEQRDRARCAVAAQANFLGFQSLRVEAMTPSFTGQHGVLSIRVGQVLLYLEDRDALFSWVAAIQRAIELQDKAYGPELPPPAFAPRKTA